ncbi:MAG: 4-hydroxy-tetrahydrodipicolinate reductase [Alphaproteobacteria bacterium]|nr:4-hydroxy-tetrahydrodipicolinate reductase [Alphaproteobacteria bacterium]
MKIGIFGATGRMGKEHIREILQNPDVSLSGAVTASGDPLIGRDAALQVGLPACDVLISDNAEELFKAADAVIDFSTPEASLISAQLAAQYRKILVIGTTGFSDAQWHVLQSYANETPIIWSSNMSVGVNLLFALTEQVAAILGEEFDIEIVEMHHRQKIDAPSGTALSLGKAAAKGRNRHFNDVAKLSREGIEDIRPRGEIGFATLRGGDVIGDHTVTFAGMGERIELTHKASNRTIYSKGAVRACLWARQKAPGLYAMKDVLQGNTHGA